MIVLVIGASEESVYAIELAKKMGHHVIVFDGNAQAEGLKHGDECHVTDIRNYKNVIECMGTRKPDLVLPTPIGRILTVTGQVNDHYGLKGVSARSADLCTDKYEFHRMLAGQGLRGGVCRLVTHSSEMAGWSEFPVILKPRFGAGSRNVYALENRRELEAVGQSLKEDFEREDYVLETMTQGQEYGVDGICLGGAAHLVLLRRKLLTPPPARQCVGYLSVLPQELPQAMWDRLFRLLSGAMAALGIEEGVFHGDFIAAEGDFFPIEISARPSGHQLHNVFTPLVTGVSVLEAYLRHMAGEAVDLNGIQVKKSMIRYFDLENCRIKSVPKEAFLREKYPLSAYCCNIAPGEVMGPVMDGHSLMGRGYFVLEGSTDRELEELGGRLLEEFETEAL